MTKYTSYQDRYFAEQLLLKRPQSSYDSLASAMSGVKVDLNPHQVDAALFAMQSPLSSGVLMADEVGLGKTIEAGLVLAQYWAERKRNILLIVPAALRTQWRSELSEKFYIDSLILESSNFNKMRKEGCLNPFDAKNQVVICSYNFAANKDSFVHAMPWDLVVLDEAHRLRNVYKPQNVTANKLKNALKGRKKLLLTATPLQNNLMELYGLVSFIDEHVFGDAKTFREMYVAVNNAELRNRNLRDRLSVFCKRTLRKQVTEYVRYTERHAILQEYTPTKDEELLYNSISSYLQTDHLYALPAGQRTLITMVLRKLLASSSFAIAGTLNSLIDRLQGLLDGIQRQLDLDDYDTFTELHDDEDDTSDFTEMDEEELRRNQDGIQSELALLQSFADLASGIKTNAKGDNLISALTQGFKKIEQLGGQRKAVIFTESRRTQEYLFNLLSNNGYEGEIVFLNGVNNDDISKKPGYLLFSTPRSAAQIVGAKLLMTLFALVGITILFSLLIALDVFLALQRNGTSLVALLSMFDASITENGLKDVLFNGYNFFGLSMYLLNTVISFIFNVIAAYVVIVLLKTVMGNQKGRTILAVILWFAITNAFNLLGGLITTQLASGLDEGNEVVVTQSSTLFLSTSLHTLFQPAMYLPTMILCIIGSIAGYWLTTWIIEKKLSV